MKGDRIGQGSQNAERALPSCPMPFELSRSVSAVQASSGLPWPPELYEIGKGGSRGSEELFCLAERVANERVTATPMSRLKVDFPAELAIRQIWPK